MAVEFGSEGKELPAGRTQGQVAHGKNLVCQLGVIHPSGGDSRHHVRLGKSACMLAVPTPSLPYLRWGIGRALTLPQPWETTIALGFPSSCLKASSYSPGWWPVTEEPTHTLEKERSVP